MASGISMVVVAMTYSMRGCVSERSGIGLAGYCEAMGQWNSRSRFYKSICAAVVGWSRLLMSMTWRLSVEKATTSL